MKRLLLTKERILQRLDQSAGPDGCWPATGAHARGYPVIKSEGRQHRLNRVIWRLWVGELPKDQLVLHRCDNPRCGNWRHYYLGDNAQNMKDRDTRGRNAHGQRQWKAKFTDGQVMEIRQCYATGSSSSQLAQGYAVSKHCVHCIVTGKTWTHLPLVERTVWPKRAVRL